MPPAPIHVTEQDVGKWFFLASVGYCLAIVFIDSIFVYRRLAISKNLLRQLLDGLTFATGVTAAASLYYPGIFAIVASNYTYSTVVSGTCLFGPVINLAERYGYLVDM
jgi:hypothetical protein